MSTVALTGGTGFVGRAILAGLIGDGHNIVSLVRSVGDVAMDPTNNRRGVAVRQLAAGDLNDPDYGAVLPPEVDAVVHCAARVHVMQERASDPLSEFRRSNVDATVSLARHAARQGVRRFIYLSSIKVNGEQTEPGRAFRSDDVPAPKDPYGVSKLEAETALRVLSTETGMSVTIIRPPLVYGPGVKGNLGLLARFMHLGLPLPLGGITENRRSLVALGNLADLVIRCLNHPGASNHTFLAGDGEDLSTAALLRMMAKAMGRNAHLLPAPPAMIGLLARAIGRPEMSERLCGSLQVDISATRQLLDWVPPLSVAEGLAAAFAEAHRGN
jgi:nucleoside-diphosphate-sugar epimerase